MKRHSFKWIALWVLLFSLLNRVLAVDFTLTTNVSPVAGGTIALVPAASVYTSNTIVTLSAIANPGFKFQKWSGASTAVTNRIALKINTNKTVTAIFTNIPMFQLVKLVSPTNAGLIGTFPAPATNGYAVGTVVTLVASNYPGFRFSRWSGAANTNVNPISVTMTTNKSITAIYTNVPMMQLTRRISPTNAGTISPTPTPATNGYAIGTTVMLTAQANYGFGFSHWTGASTAATNRIFLVMNTNKLVTAVFTNLPAALLSFQVNPPNAGVIHASPFSSSGIYPLGTKVTLTAVANGTNLFAAWQGLSSISNQVTFAMTGSRTISALFNNKGKFIFQNTNGFVNMWFMQQTNWLASGLLNNGVSAGSNWRVAGAADFDNNGSKDILFRSTNGQVALWQMSENFKTNTVRLKTVSTTYQVGAMADFNSDSQVDILWQNGHGVLALWIMGTTNNIITNVASVSLPSSGAAWRAFAAAPLDLTNSSQDIFFQNTTDRRVAVWLMNTNGTDKTASVVLKNNQAPAAGWTAVGATDLNEDGKTDVVFQHTDGRILVWFFDGFTFKGAVILNKANPSAWRLQATK